MTWSESFLAALKDNDVRLKQTVRYDDYKQFKAKSSITFGGEADSKDPKKP